MRIISFKQQLSVYFLSLILLTACNHGPAKSRQEKVAASTRAVPAPQSPYGEVNTWLDDFKNFRTAVYRKDVSKMKTYFNFPVNADTTQLWETVYESVADDQRPQTYPGTFTAADLEKYHQKLFTDAFTQSLLKVKSDQLFRKGEYTTSVIKKDGQKYHMVATYNKDTTTLQLDVMYAGWPGENGEEMSEGESAVIYFFRVENNRYLKFDKILFAG